MKFYAIISSSGDEIRDKWTNKPKAIFPFFFAFSRRFIC